MEYSGVHRYDIGKIRIYECLIKIILSYGFWNLENERKTNKKNGSNRNAFLKTTFKLKRIINCVINEHIEIKETIVDCIGRYQIISFGYVQRRECQRMNPNWK